MAVAVWLAGCGDITGQLAARSNACAARGGVLTGMGCEGGRASFDALPGRADKPPPSDRYGQPNYDSQGRYVGGHGVGVLLDRPPGDAALPHSAEMPANVVCAKNAEGDAGNCVSH